MVTAPDALAVYVPAVLLLMVSVQVSTLPLTVGEPQLEVLVVRLMVGEPQVVSFWDRPALGETLVEMAALVSAVPAGSTAAVTWKTCWWPTGLVAVNGAILM